MPRRATQAWSSPRSPALPSRVASLPCPRSLRDCAQPAAPAPAGSITVPSLASVYNEFALKKHMETSVLLQACGGGPGTGRRGRASPPLTGSPGQAGHRRPPAWSTSRARHCHCPCLCLAPVRPRPTAPHPPPTPPHPQNFFLYFYGFCFNAMGLLFVMAVDGGMRPGTLLHGFRAVRRGLRGLRGGPAPPRGALGALGEDRRQCRLACRAMRACTLQVRAGGACPSQPGFAAAPPARPPALASAARARRATARHACPPQPPRAQVTFLLVVNNALQGEGRMRHACLSCCWPLCCRPRLRLVLPVAARPVGPPTASAPHPPCTHTAHTHT